MHRKKRVLFVCTANAVRSQMAEALLRRLRPDTYEVFSAGTAPTEVDPRALRALELFDVVPSGLHSKSLEQFRGQAFDYVIALCKKSGAECQTVQCDGEYMAWDFEDPQTVGTSHAFVKTLKEIQQRIQMFLLVTEKE
ncbi:MAG TPA: arsenate reductase ArsC [Methylophaga aminisulfidivorans]|uniref:arsenate reductase ArsC n=1 Tax=Methylophaga TaxID=40222 RepID=UPI001A113AB1|nr:MULTISPECIES: arsenate reductase ArsC [Methylophaga]WVI83652.1 arsenate reductase ArsC [Methylophaga thalassica]HIM40158.1 arsenate reductase ArsC [Methylophaga aminisulfidivorans]